MSSKTFSAAMRSVWGVLKTNFDRLDDHHGAGKRNEGHAAFRRGGHRHGGAGGGAADQDVDLVVVDQALGETVGLVGVAAVVVMNEAPQLAAEDAALLVDVFDVLLQVFSSGSPRKAAGPVTGKNRTDLDRVGGEAKGRRGTPGRRRRQVFGC